MALTGNSAKVPHPTSLQSEFILASRKVADRQRRIITTSLVSGIIVMLLLTVFSVIQARNATQQAKIALVRQLTAQAQSINATRSSKQMVAALLAVESMKLYPLGEGAQLLLNSNEAGRPIARMIHDDYVISVAFSPDGRYIVSGSSDSTARVWRWQPQDLITNACAYMPRNLTRGEWQLYIGDALPYEAVCENLPIELEIAATPLVNP